jgi:hypothetical protein
MGKYLAYSAATPDLNPREKQASGILVVPPLVSVLVACESRGEQLA